MTPQAPGNEATETKVANAAAIAAILADTQDDPMCNKAVRVAHEILRQVPGAAFEAEPFMLTGLARIGDQEYVACNCFYHSVLILEKCAFVYSTEEGGMVPWHDRSRLRMPYMDHFDCSVAIDPSVSEALLSYVRELASQHQELEPSELLERESCTAPGI